MNTTSCRTCTLGMLLWEAGVHEKNGKRQEAAKIRAWVADLLSEQSKVVRSVWRRLPKASRTTHENMQRLAAAIIMGLAMCTMAMTGRAATMTVTNTNDSGPGSLRNALSIANDGDTITFAVTGSIGLTSGQLLVNHSITISGPGAENLAVNGNANSRVFHVSHVGGGVTISGLTITNGHASGNYPDDSGGGIYNDHAVLTLNNCVIDGNYAAFWGSGIYNDGDSATLITLNDCTVSGNDGAGIANHGQAMATLNSCTVTDNNGSGIYNVGGSFNPSATVTLNDCTVTGNTAGYSGLASGGGIYNAGTLNGGNAAVTLNNSTVSNNWASDSGGGIYNDAFGGSVIVTMTNCTLSGNTAANNDGGGISNRGNAAVVISNSTLSNNSAFSNGGGIFNTSATAPFGGNSTVNISNSTLSGNSAPGGSIYNSASGGYGATAILDSTILKAGALGGNIHNFAGTIISHGYNLSSDNGGAYLTRPSDQINTDPLLGPLQDNGGPTFMHELLPNSPAINAGDPDFTPPPFYDQRGSGFDRVRNRRIDIGSFEVQESAPTPTPTATATPTATPTATATATPTATATFTPTPTATATATATPSATPTGTPRPTPTPRPALTPRPRPTPAARPAAPR
jgi:hypothetical protein